MLKFLRYVSDLQNKLEQTEAQLRVAKKDIEDYKYELAQSDTAFEKERGLRIRAEERADIAEAQASLFKSNLSFLLDGLDRATEFIINVKEIDKKFEGLKVKYKEGDKK